MGGDNTSGSNNGNNGNTSSQSKSNNDNNNLITTTREYSTTQKIIAAVAYGIRRSISGAASSNNIILVTLLTAFASVAIMTVNKIALTAYRYWNRDRRGGYLVLHLPTVSCYILLYRGLTYCIDIVISIVSQTRYSIPYPTTSYPNTAVAMDIPIGEHS